MKVSTDSEIMADVQRIARESFRHGLYAGVALMAFAWMAVKAFGV